MKLIITLAVILSTLLTAAPTFATAEPEKSGPAVTIHTEWAPQYLSFGAGINLYDDPVLQGSVTLNWDNGTYLFLWGSTDMSGRPGDSLGDEYDLGVGWAGTIKEWNVDIGATYFDEPHLGKVARLGEEDIIYIHLKAGREIGCGWTASAGFESYMTLPDTGYNGGNLWSLELSKTFKVSPRVSIPFSVATVYDDGGFGFDNGVFLRGNLGVDLQLTPTLTANVGGRYYVPISTHDSRENDTMAYIGLTWKPGAKK